MAKMYMTILILENFSIRLLICIQCILIYLTMMRSLTLTISRHHGKYDATTGQIHLVAIPPMSVRQKLPTWKVSRDSADFKTLRRECMVIILIAVGTVPINQSTVIGLSGQSQQRSKLSPYI